MKTGKIGTSILDYAKVMEHQCANIEELMLKVLNECEVRGYSTQELCNAAGQVRQWYIAYCAKREELRAKYGKKKQVRFYPCDAKGNCVRGFCPTICNADEADELAMKLAEQMMKYGYKFDHMIIENI